MHFRRPVRPSGAAVAHVDSDVAAAARPGVQPGDSTGGYRVVRQLGAGNRATVVLGYGESVRREHASGEAADTVALKVFHPTTSSSSIALEVEALTRAPQEHVVGLHDMGGGPGGLPCLILERLEPISLLQLLHTRTSLDPGEAVTVLAPIARLVEQMHREGVAHQGIRPAAVLFRASGAPVLAGFGHASLFSIGESRAGLARRTDVQNDYHALMQLARRVIEPGAGPNSHTMVRWLSTLENDGVPEGFAALLAHQLFDWAEAQPVRFAAETHSAVHPQQVPARAIALAAPSAGAECVGVPERHPAQRGRTELWSDASAVEPTATVRFRLPAWLLEILAELPIANTVRRGWELIKNRASRVRTPAWMLGAAVAAVILIAVAFVPQPSDQGAPQSQTATPLAEPPRAASPALGEGTSQSPEDAVLADDPVAALSALLQTRARCFRELSILCLDAVGQQGSEALEHDQGLIRSIQDGGEVPEGITIVPGVITLIERLGNSALLGLDPDEENEPASTLIIKGEAGWRIRSYLTR